MEEEMIIKLSKEYQILSKKTSLFAVAENEENNKIGELKQITKKKKKGLFDDILLNNNNNLNVNSAMHYDMPMNYNINKNNQSDDLFGDIDSDNKYNKIPLSHHNYDMKKNSLSSIKCCMAAPKSLAFKHDEDSDDEPKYEAKKCEKKSSFKLSKKKAKAREKRVEKEEKEGDMDMDMGVDYCMAAPQEYRMMEGEDLEAMENKEYGGELEEKEPEKEVKKENDDEKKIEFSNKELVLTQDIFDGCWNLNPQTKLLIEKEKDIYDKIEGIMKEKNIDKEEVKITLLVLYYLNTNNSINKVEYMLIIKKGISYLDENGIKFDDIFTTLKN